MKIYFKEAEGAKNLRELLDKGFSCRLYSNLYLQPTSTVKFQPTYSDKNFTVLECASARRSFYDLLQIARTYFPETTEKELAYYLLFQLKNRVARYCITINKVVFYRILDDDEKELRWLDGSKATPDYIGISFNYIKKLADVQDRRYSSDRPGWNSF